jgi:hypothetical protein
MDPGRTKPALAQRIQQTPLVSVAVVKPARGARGRGRRGAGRVGSGRRPAKTTDELDQEMMDYYQEGNNTGAAGTS